MRSPIVSNLPPSTAMRLKTCDRGHRYHKRSDCPTCPVCEAERRPENGFLSEIAAPARRALEREGITTPAALSACSEREILGLHGVGPGTMPRLREALDQAGMRFREAGSEASVTRDRGSR